MTPDLDGSIRELVLFFFKYVSFKQNLYYMESMRILLIWLPSQERALCQFGVCPGLQTLEDLSMLAKGKPRWKWREHSNLRFFFAICGFYSLNHLNAWKTIKLKMHGTRNFQTKPCTRRGRTNGAFFSLCYLDWNETNLICGII